MIAFAFTMATIAIAFVVMALYCCSIAFVARRFGVGVERIEVGTGPLLVTLLGAGSVLQVRSIPICGNVKCISDEFLRLSPFLKLIIHLAGPLSTVVLGLLLICIPVVTYSRQLVVVPAGETGITPCACVGLAVQNAPATCEGQYQFFCDSAVYYLCRLITFRSLNHWGGPLGCLVTCALVAKHDLMAWLTCIGTISLAIGLGNLLPIPMLAGGHIVFLLYGMLTGREPSEKWQITLSLLGFCLVLVLFARTLWLDITWIFGIVRTL
jgi:membrane-associated protease RseP (regulator of RpoE activity)